MGWSFRVVNVEKDTSVTIRTFNMPSNVMMDVKIGRSVNGQYEWIKLDPPLDTDRGGSFNVQYGIPLAFAGESNLAIRVVQVKKNGNKFNYTDHFANVDGGIGTGGPGNGAWNPWGIPTIWIASVKRNQSVTFTTHNFPPNMDFQVRMGPMGTMGIGGYVVDTFNSGAGGTMTVTVPIPAALANSPQISIRTQNNWSGYYSYNWFFNNTTPW
jgi:hypothetical protein